MQKHVRKKQHWDFKLKTVGQNVKFTQSYWPTLRLVYSQPLK